LNKEKEKRKEEEELLKLEEEYDELLRQEEEIDNSRLSLKEKVDVLIVVNHFFVFFFNIIYCFSNLKEYLMFFNQNCLMIILLRH
jgi:hypothetical protein